ncbi:hypothetical protein CPB84DRAFT_1790141 [Gymnopilus junonius]|uniref:Uncharacterized protein n=1 Tax=Gymnopilus junonius TaxID=109634 RepID=A0A9P5TI05_GYMJU|nr:hypothetical protein CPB84DRAFT_1790141 [Gymnopilus junonius]
MLALGYISTPVSILQLHGILASTPALEELHIAPSNPFDPALGQFNIPGPNHVVTPPWTIVPGLKFIHLGGYEPSTTGQRDQSELIWISLVSPWFDLGRPGNRIARIEFNHSGDEKLREELERFITEFPREVPLGGEIALREENAPFLWHSRQSEGSLMDCFDDTRFRLRTEGKSMD